MLTALGPSMGMLGDPGHHCIFGNRTNCSRGKTAVKKSGPVKRSGVAARLDSTWDDADLSECGQATSEVLLVGVVDEKQVQQVSEGFKGKNPHAFLAHRYWKPATGVGFYGHTDRAFDGGVARRNHRGRVRP